MKGSIKIDVDFDNSPIVRIKVYGSSDDLRDKILKRFVEGIGYESNYLRITPISTGNMFSDDEHSDYDVQAIGDSELEDLKKEIEEKLAKRSETANNPAT